MVSFGENLRRERELRGIELAEIAAATKIGVRFLRAIEQDRVDILPGGVFPRAFVRQYAAFVGLDVERTVAEFVGAYGSRPSETPATPVRRSRAGRSATALLAAAGLLGLGLVLAGRPGSRNRSAGMRLPTIGATSPSRATTPDPAQAAGIVLQMRAEKECWVEAHVDGQTFMNRTLVVGEATTVEAANEILLTVGNAGGLVVSLNGQPALPLGRNGEVRRKVRITRENLPTFVQTPVTVASSRSG